MDFNLIVLIFIINALVSLLYLAISLFYAEDKIRRLFLTIFFILCPIVGSVCFALSALFYKLRLNKSIEISGIHFSDEKLRYQRSEDYATEIDVAPLEEVLRISGVKDKRERLLESIKSDINANMATYSAAVLNQDSEVSHYAAAILSKTKDNFDRSLSQLSVAYDADRTDSEVNTRYIWAEHEYLHCGLQLFREERIKHLYTYSMLCENLRVNHPSLVTEELYTNTVNCLIELHENEKAHEWLGHFSAAYPKSENSYICKLRFYYETGDHSEFFNELARLKSSGIPINSGTIDLIRFFNKRSKATA